MKLFIPTDAFARHCYIIGRSRYGKTNLANNLFTQRMWAGDGCTFIEPHGDASLENLGRVPAHRIKDVIYYDPSREDCPSLNLYALPYEPYKVAHDITDFLKTMFLDSWGQKVDSIVLHGNYLLITDWVDAGVPHSFADLPKVLSSERYRNALVRRTKRESEAAFWGTDGEFSQISKDSKASVLSKIGGLFLSGSLTERLFSGTENEVDFVRLINGGGIGIFPLSRGKLGAAVSNFLGQVIVSSIVEAAFARAAQNPTDRRMHYLFVDEFQEYASRSAFSDILSQTGKYKLALCMMHQFLDQIPHDLISAIFANVNAVVAFRVYERDATTICREMKGRRQFARVKGRGEYTLVPEVLATVRATLDEQIWDYEQRGQGRSPVCVEMRNALHAVSSPSINADALDEIIHTEFGGKVKDGGVRLFPDMEFTEDAYPSVDDLINLPRYQAFIRLGNASNVRKLKTTLAREPNGKIIETKHAMNREQMERRPSRPEIESSPQEPDSYLE